MRGRLACVEANTTGTGMIALRTAGELGLDPLFLTGKPERYQGLAESGAQVVRCDTNDAGELLAALAPRAGDLCGVTTTSDFYVATVAELAAQLGLPGNPPEAVRLCRDKGRMRRALAKAGARRPRFAVLHDQSETAEAVTRVGLPCVVKPVSGSGSENVRLCASQAEVRAQVAQVLSVRTNIRGQACEPAALVEEYLDGPEFSVEMVHTGGEAVCVGIVAKTLTGRPYFVESGHVYPAPVAKADAEAMESAVRLALAATGIQHGPTHTEVKLLSDGVAVVEINPRLAGGMIPELISLVDGLDLLEQQIRGAIGLPVTLARRREGHAGIRFLVADRPGAVRAVSGADQVAALPGIEQVSVSARPGVRVGPPRSAYDRLGHVIARGRTVPELTARLDRAVAGLHVEVGE
ncbi:ATP-grasp domain-containing protein [Sphaerisporangium perillae]|uniref:ATP-grasp domain-containing protein n=1 Tax=Sphaerisporangium perillae TaxID=2935860 RepID=UPI00200D6B13|nr:ATP-grasp domain-containing protein [Sphaerisporangium perillae]